MKRELIEDALLSMGIPASVKGFKYIIDFIEIMEKEPGEKTTWMYHMVARKNNATTEGVERAIRHSLEIARKCSISHDAVAHYIGFENCCNSPSLSRLLLMLKREENHGEN